MTTTTPNPDCCCEGVFHDACGPLGEDAAEHAAEHDDVVSCGWCNQQMTRRYLRDSHLVGSGECAQMQDRASRW